MFINITHLRALHRSIQDYCLPKVDQQIRRHLVPKHHTRESDEEELENTEDSDCNIIIEQVIFLSGQKVSYFNCFQLFEPEPN